MSRLEIPGKMGVVFKKMPGPHAAPVTVTLQNSPDSVETFVAGGLTKRQHIATSLLSGMLSSGLFDARTEGEQVLLTALQLADAMLLKTEGPTGQVSSLQT